MAAPGILKSLPTSIRDVAIVNLLKRQPNTNYFKLAYFISSELKIDSFPLNFNL